MNDEDDGNDKDKWDGGALLWTWSILVAGEGGGWVHWQGGCLLLCGKGASRSTTKVQGAML